jgi:hypothetical protein
MKCRSGWTDGFDIYLTNPGSSSNGDTSTCTFEKIEFIKM